MKKIILLACLLCAAAGCRSTTTTTNTSPSGGTTSNDATPISATGGGCSNPYYPIGANVRREYRTTFAKNNLPASNYTETFSAVTDTNFVQRQQIGGGSGEAYVERRWGCGAAGLGSEDYTDISVSQSNFKFKSLAHQGVLVPPPADWKQGGVWDYSYDVSGEGQMPGGGNRPGAPSVETKGTIKVRNEIVAEEQVNVPAGNFTAWKVRSTITQNLQTKMGGMSVPTNIALEMDSWYAKDVGLIKSAIKDFGATTELVSFAK